jgi:phosphosulfolactate synthase
VSGTSGGFLLTPGREGKPRRHSVTHALDTAVPTELLAAYLANAGAFVDVVKLGWGLGYIDPQLSQRAQLCRQHGVILSAGGTLLEIAAHQHKIAEFAAWAAAHGIGAVEVSNGLGLLTIEEKSKIIANLCDRFMVLAETGSKDEHAVADPRSWAEEMSSDLESGATWVIAEGRESGTAGLYYQDGSVRTGLLDAILDRIGPERVIFEAPKKAQQAWLIRRIGPHANLGNVRIEDVMAIETLRLGLRADTFTPCYANATER